MILTALAVVFGTALLWLLLTGGSDEYVAELSCRECGEPVYVPLADGTEASCPTCGRVYYWDGTRLADRRPPRVTQS